ncbi:MAG: ribonuclease H-like domain-containing protein [Chloroflexi bacterium]|nr:ribonuclease H-like domain-containing protein [Chloroflexota bacterium]
MTDLEDRLRKLRSLGVHKGTAHLKPAPPARRRYPVEDLVAGRVVENEAGAFYLVEETFPLHHAHGAPTLGDLLACPCDVPARLARDPAIADMDYRRAAFLDIETIGLAGGTGTVAFMVGLGFYEDDALRVEQYFMRDFPEEPAMLAALARRLDDMDWLVSFNGRGFDLPILTTRFIMNRMPPRLADAPHLDLLFPARRLWKSRLESCRLSALEKAILGFYRDQADVPGYLVPQIYFDYLRTGDAREIARVFYHNLYDIVSLAALAGHMCRLLHAPDAATTVPGEDLLRAAVLLEQAGDAARAEAAYRRAIASPLSPEAREEALHHLAVLLKRQGRRDEAREIWRTLAEARYGADVAALVELAKDCEHRQRDYAAALAYTEQALARVQAWPPGAQKTRALAELQRRAERVRRKTLAGGGAA